MVAGDFATLAEWCIQKAFMTTLSSAAGRAGDSPASRCQLNVQLVAVFYLLPIILDVLRVFIVDLGKAGLSAF
jgi:hypothetical protein